MVEISLEELEEDIEEIVEYDEYNPNFKIHPLDLKYPHICFECKKPIGWRELLFSNLPSYVEPKFKGPQPDFFVRQLKEMYSKYKWMKRMWRSKVVQMYCCSCFHAREKEELLNGAHVVS